MKKFTVTFQREFTVEVEAHNSLLAARMVCELHPHGSVKLLSVLAEDHNGAPCAACAEGPQKPTPPGNRPLGGGSPGTPTVSVPVLADQIAKAA